MQPRSHGAEPTAGAPSRNAEAATSKVTPVVMCTGKGQKCGTAAAVRRGEVCTELRLLLQKFRKPKPGVGGGAWVLCGSGPSPPLH